LVKNSEPAACPPGKPRRPSRAINSGLTAPRQSSGGPNSAAEATNAPKDTPSGRSETSSAVRVTG
jgi:hypothetical protein